MCWCSTLCCTEDARLLTGGDNFKDQMRGWKYLPGADGLDIAATGGDAGPNSVKALGRTDRIHAVRAM
jgi:hypothetical protein